jgi:hypothetical protein
MEIGMGKIGFKILTKASQTENRHFDDPMLILRHKLLSITKHTI